MRTTAPAWHEILNAGKESITCDLKAEPERARALCADADVVIEGFRPGVANRLGIGPADLPETVVYCSITGFGLGGRHELRAGHDLNYQAGRDCSPTRRRRFPRRSWPTSPLARWPP